MLISTLLSGQSFNTGAHSSMSVDAPNRHLMLLQRLPTPCQVSVWVWYRLNTLTKHNLKAGRESAWVTSTRRFFVVQSFPCGFHERDLSPAMMKDVEIKTGKDKVWWEAAH